jgi:GntR family transcriptional regulator
LTVEPAEGGLGGGHRIHSRYNGSRSNRGPNPMLTNARCSDSVARNERPQCHGHASRGDPLTASRHQLLAETLIGKITDGTYAVGDRLPTEEDLCSEYGMARGTVRKAFDRLDNLGLITRRPSAGTRVIAPAPMTKYQPVAQSAADIATLAAETRLVKPDSFEVVVNAELSRRTGIRKGTRWFVLQGPRVRRSDESLPVCWSEHYQRADAPRSFLLRGNITAEDVAKTRIEQTISGALIEDYMAEGVKAERGGPALVVTRRAKNMSGRLVSVGIHTHPADRYSITMEL